MTQLETLSLHFVSLPPTRNHLSLPPPPGERVTLPTLRILKYRGTSKYLDNLVAIIDAYHAENMNITFFSQPTMDASELGRFVEQIETTQTSLNQADVQTSPHAISISFTGSSSAFRTPLRLQLSCKQIDWQLSLISQICNQFTPFLFYIKNVGIDINTADFPNKRGHAGGQAGGEQWPELVCSFALVQDSYG